MKHSSLACVAFALLLGSEYSRSADSSNTPYQITTRSEHPTWMLSITRLTSCEIKGPPTQVIRVPWELYPADSIHHVEEGKVVMTLVFDQDWCVRKATITQSSGYYRLDNVSLEFTMYIKFQFVAKEFEDGQPTLTFPINWKLHPR